MGPRLQMEWLQYGPIHIHYNVGGKCIHHKPGMGRIHLISIRMRIRILLFSMNANANTHKSTVFEYEYNCQVFMNAFVNTSIVIIIK